MTPASSRRFTFRPMALIWRGAAIETLRRKDFYVLLILGGLFALGMLAVRIAGVENEATATFLLNLAMTFASLSAHMLTLLAAARQAPNEIESRTIYPILAKPLSRTEFLMGKWVAATAAGAVTLASLLLVSWFPIPRPQGLSVVLLAQTLALQAVSIALLAALAIAGSLVLPRSLNLVLTGLVFAAGGRFVALIRSRASGASGENIALWLSGYLPNFSLLNLTTRYTDGIAPLPGPEFFGLVLYGAILIGFSLWAGGRVFARKAL